MRQDSFHQRLLQSWFFPGLV